MIDSIIFSINDFYSFMLMQFAIRGAWEWLIFFLPFYVFGEFPRYILPNIIMLFVKLMGGMRDDFEAKTRFMETHPSISILLVGLNEEKNIKNAIESLINLEYEGIDIIVVDDNSTDQMYEFAKPYADKGLIKLFKNTGASGRSGRASALNMALQFSSGEFILALDSDTSFDRDMLLHMIGPFYNPKVGAVAGNLKVRNLGASIWTDLQMVEYMISIGLSKRWLGLFGMNIQASGAFSSFRREAIEKIGGWDQELAEDSDISLKIKKSGWTIAFAPNGIAMTNVPETRAALVRQRLRWDKGTLRTFFHKHGSLLKFWQYGWRSAIVLASDYFFTVFLTFIYIGYIAVMLTLFPKILVFVWIVCYFLYALSSFFMISAAIILSERRSQEWHLLWLAFAFPLYQSYFRWVRFGAMALETFRINYEDPYLPESAWRNTERW